MTQLQENPLSDADDRVVQNAATIQNSADMTLQSSSGEADDRKSASVGDNLPDSGEGQEQKSPRVSHDCLHGNVQQNVDDASHNQPEMLQHQSHIEPSTSPAAADNVLSNPEDVQDSDILDWQLVALAPNP